MYKTWPPSALDAPYWSMPFPGPPLSRVLDPERARFLFEECQGAEKPWTNVATLALIKFATLCQGSPCAVPWSRHISQWPPLSRVFAPDGQVSVRGGHGKASTTVAHLAVTRVAVRVGRATLSAPDRRLADACLSLADAQRTPACSCLSPALPGNRLLSLTDAWLSPGCPWLSPGCPWLSPALPGNRLLSLTDACLSLADA